MRLPRALVEAIVEVLVSVCSVVLVPWPGLLWVLEVVIVDVGQLFNYVLLMLFWQKVTILQVILH